MKFLKLIRLGNLGFMALCLMIIRYAFFSPVSAATTLSDLQYTLLTVSILCLGAAGYIINDLHNIDADKINKPTRTYIGNGVSEKAGFNAFLVFNIIGVGIGFYLANVIGYPAFSALFIISSALLYIYSTYLKNKILLGNISVSFLVASIVILPGIFDLLPAINSYNQRQQAAIFSTLLDYSFFAFLINLLREMVKDQEEIKGHYNTGGNTLPIILGTKSTNWVIFALGLIPLTALIYYIYTYLFENTLAVLYSLFLLVAPLLFFLIQILSAKQKKDFSRLSKIMKIILFFGLISIGFQPFILN